MPHIVYDLVNRTLYRHAHTGWGGSHPPIPRLASRPAAARQLAKTQNYSHFFYFCLFALCQPGAWSGMGEAGRGWGMGGPASSATPPLVSSIWISRRGLQNYQKCIISLILLGHSHP